jgi:hypothetical protein
MAFQELEVYEYSVKFDSERGGLAEDVTFKFIGYELWYQAQTDDSGHGPEVQIAGTTAQSTA